ncbi:MAG: hypothetical protein RBT50_06295 [Bacteroidales bacterium]|jgi:hypothetical protein|nr:hypothetical protein [Bacteroidales bacterium]
MRLSFIPALAVMLVFSGCGGEEQQTSGTITLTNELYDGGSYYYAMGLSFDEAKEVPTLPDAYRADITLMAGAVTSGGPVLPFLSSNTLDPPFALVSNHITAAESVSAFRALKTVGSYTWIDLAAPISTNQVWVVKTRDGTYAKLRIVSLTLDTSVTPAVATCKLEWVWQPDGSATFP